ncbi:hypothetical protein DFH06DRAFT_1242449 [Mycena polygramma]|nr:hypothetical protein DFH06DRAFT_1242449 [Mycena polygramma]
MPVLPTDLEREIFEITAVRYPRSIPRLVLVAQRVKIWIEPMLYRTLSVVESAYRFQDTQTLRIEVDASLHSKPASFLRSHVRHVALSKIPTDMAASILSVCTEATSLAIFQTPAAPTLLPLLVPMPLSRLSVGLAELFGRPTVDFGHPIFARLTHLDIFEAGWDSDHMVSGLSGLPRLTHLSFNPDPNETTPRVPDILASCELLQVLVILFPDENDMRDVGDEYKCFSDDLRFVTMVVMITWRIGRAAKLAGWTIGSVQRYLSGSVDLEKSRRLNT